NVCLDFFVFAEFYRKTGKATFCELCLAKRNRRQLRRHEAGRKIKELKGPLTCMPKRLQSTPVTRAIPQPGLWLFQFTKQSLSLSTALITRLLYSTSRCLDIVTVES